MKKDLNTDDNVEMEYNNDDWVRYKIWVIDNIRRLRTEVDNLRIHVNDTIMFKLNDLENKITALQVKSGVWGLIAGLLGVAITMFIKSQLDI